MLIALMTRIPEPGFTKTRLETHLTKEECAQLHSAFIKDIITILEKAPVNYQIFYDIHGNRNRLQTIIPRHKLLVPQVGHTLGEKMLNAMLWGFNKGYEKVAVLGTDIPSIDIDTIVKADSLLNHHDVVVGPTGDGGYYLLGMKNLYKDIFQIKNWGDATVLERTIANIDHLGLSWVFISQHQDIDNFDDLKKLWQELEQGQLKNTPINTYKLLKSLNIEQRITRLGR
ncbi:TIGR04282 family arsenosugar biosynthesis glycosyltransferase [Desulfitibacter alkalitolerans]|uniref:TIGR04282 family arsenosugar biosynthesis glycosyltransferase n=1 Tax=Desulfitibacter alkalitolerans TaxID=264641 RepID=UPI00068603BA|nr:TIGR04282 family arsenosugar biosynthesis glycosyltransferase [Desulfitibacter alkalitolerans]